MHRLDRLAVNVEVLAAMDMEGPWGGTGQAGDGGLGCRDGSGSRRHRRRRRCSDSRGGKEDMAVLDVGDAVEEGSGSFSRGLDVILGVVGGNSDTFKKEGGKE